MTACFALIFGWHGDGRGQLAGTAANLARYVDHNLVELAAKFAPPHPLAHQLRRWVDEIAALSYGQSLDLRPADYFYRLLAIEPFPGILKNENRARNLAIFSQLLNTFQNYYHYPLLPLHLDSNIPGKSVTLR
jgi:DNA helicase II / ATP-dependent DNA helicase PcrA